MMKPSAAAVRILTAGVLMTFAGTVAAQRVYPNKPIRIIVSVAAGGSVDYLARLVGQKLTESWGQQAIVDNRPGGNNVIGSEALVRSTPDGYTIMLASTGHTTNPSLLPNLPYDTVKDFAPVAGVSSSVFVLVLHPSVPATNLRELIALAKSSPRQLNYSSAGNGTSNHLGAEIFNAAAGVTMQHIPYKGGGPAIVNLVGGQVDLSFASALSVIPHINSGRLKAIAITGESRLPSLPRVPTFAEAGLAGFDLKNWYGVLAPARTPRAIVELLSAEIAKVLTAPDVREKLVSQGMEPLILNPDQFAVMLKVETARYAKVIKAANIRVEM
jgi:tripartite-type tricarboxylate transporter receptor subunit TctC